MEEKSTALSSVTDKIDEVISSSRKLKRSVNDNSYTCGEFTALINNFTTSIDEGTSVWSELVDDITNASVDQCSGEEISAMEEVKSTAESLQAEVESEIEEKEQELEELESELTELQESLQTTVGKIQLDS